MKSITSLFLDLLLVGRLFPQTDVEEVYKLPGLIAHYKLHQKTAPRDFDFWQFLDVWKFPAAAFVGQAQTV